MRHEMCMLDITQDMEAGQPCAALACFSAVQEHTLGKVQHG